MWLRQGRVLPTMFARRTVIGVFGGLSVFTLVHLVVVAVKPDALARIPLPFAGSHLSAIGVLSALGACLFAIGTPEALGHAAADFPQPKIRNLRRAARLVGGCSLLFVAGSGFVFASLVPAGERALWRDAPLASFAWFDGMPPWFGFPLAAAVALASMFVLTLAIHRSAVKAQELLLRLSEDGVVPRIFRTLHPRFGTPYRLIDLTAIAQLTMLLAGAGQLAWLARAYAVVIASGALLKIAALVRLRTAPPGAAGVPGRAEPAIRRARVAGGHARARSARRPACARAGRHR